MVKDHNFDASNLASTRANDLTLSDLDPQVAMMSSDSQTTAAPAADSELDSVNIETLQKSAASALVDQTEVTGSTEEISKREEMPDGKVSMSTQVSVCYSL